MVFGCRIVVCHGIESLFLQIRGPCLLAALLVGSALGVAGTAFQGLFRNPLVSPDILGASSGAALGAVIGIFLSLGVLAIQALAFVGGLVAVAAVYAIGSAVRSPGPLLGVRLPRGGVRAPPRARGRPGRGLPAADRPPGAQHGAGENPAGHPHRRGRHAVLHLAARQRAEDLVMILEGRALTIGYPDHTVGSGLDVALGNGEVLA